MNSILNSALKNWQTSIAGLIVFVALVGGELGLPPKVVSAATTIATAYGLLAAKQANVTGGTVFQGDGVKAAEQKAVQATAIVDALPPTAARVIAAETPPPKP